MSGHTPGPWRVVEEDEFNLTVRADGHGVTASVFSGWAHEEGQAAQRANAALIAAAPDLLAALEMCVRTFCVGNWPDEEAAQTAARAAIALAKGETK